MRATLRLAWRHLIHHRVRSLLFVLAVSLVFLLPASVEILVENYGENLQARAKATPLLVGSRGSRFDLVLNSLYFQGRVPRRITAAEEKAARDAGLALVVPLLTGPTAQDFPVVATSVDYAAQRGLVLAAGEKSAMPGQAVIGSAVAEALGLRCGDPLLTDRGNLYDLSSGYPLRLRVAGILAPSGSADDSAVFVDLKTGWILEGLGHGHDDTGEDEDHRVLQNEDGSVTFEASVREYTEITAENVDSFHFHVGPSQLPLTSLLLWPESDRARTILLGRYRIEGNVQALVPEKVVDEVLLLVLRIKRFLDANSALVIIATTIFLILIVALTLRVRRREFNTLHRIGCARFTVAGVVIWELAILVASGIVIAFAAAYAASLYVEHAIFLFG